MDHSESSPPDDAGRIGGEATSIAHAASPPVLTARLKSSFLAAISLSSSDLPLDAYLDLVSSTLLEMTAATSTVIEWIEGGELVYRAASGAVKRHVGTRMALANSLSGLCIKERAVLVSPDTSVDPRVDAEACRKVRAAAMVVAPVIHEDHAVAVLKLISDVPVNFSDTDIQTLEVFASSIASTMARHRTRSEKERLIEERATIVAELNAQTSLREDYESRLSDALQRRRTILEAANEAFVCVDADGRIIDWNRAATTIFGWRAADTMGLELASLIVPARFRESPGPHGQHVLTRGAYPLDQRVETVVKRSTSEEFPVEITISRFDFDGEIQFAFFLHDITERRRIADADEKFRLIIQSVKDYAIFMLNPNGTIATWNSGAQAIKGYAPTEIIGQHFSTFYTPEDLAIDKPGRELETAARVGRVEDEGWRVRKDGSTFWANVVITALRDADGNLQGFAKVTRDMTQRRRLEELEASSRRMNEFLALLAHELRNPLAPIRNAVSILKVKATEDIEVIQSRNIVDRQLAHLTRLVDDLLDAGRISTGKIHLGSESVSMTDVVRLSAEGSEPLIHARDQKLTLRFPDEPLHVIGDPTRLAQVFQNLINNAAKFSPRGTEILLNVLDEGGFVAVRVVDRGRGISEAALGSIFDLFVQEHAPGANHDEGGLGIGLTLARAIIELHGGRIEAASLGRDTGSTFTVRLPKARTPLQTFAPLDRMMMEHKQAVRVLVVDDNKDSADSMAVLLNVLGHETLVAYDALQALSIVRDFDPHAVLLDLSMPTMTGFEAIGRLRAATPRTVVVAAMTGLGSDDDRARTRAAGFDLHLTKPVDLPELEGLLKMACEDRMQ